LADSIRRFGILQPITVRTSSENDSKCRKPYEIICGERRYRAAIIAGLVSVPCCVLNTTDMNSAELSIIENLIRDDLNMFEQAESFNLLITTFGLTQEEVANRVSLSQSAVANKIRLLKFEQKERELILSSGLTERHARALLRLSDITTRQRFIEIIIKDRLNVASTEALIDNYLDYLSKQPEDERKKPKEKQNNRKYATGIVKDLRVLTNTVEKAADTLRKSGIFVETASSETDTYYNITITIPKSQERFHVKH
jgi:ParB family chromosome partitioning protein